MDRPSPDAAETQRAHTGPDGSSPTLVADPILSWKGISESETDDARLSPTTRFANWVSGFDAAGFLFSLIIHAGALVILSMIIVQGLRSDVSALLFTEGERESETVIEELLNPRIEDPGVPEEAPAMHLQLMEVTNAVTDRSVPAPSFDLLTEPGEGAGEQGEDENAGFAVGPGANAVTAGNFTVWTVPNDPEPGENYRVYVRIKLPKRIRRYPVGDLEGTVIGTDKYRQEIPGPTRRRHLPVKKHETQFFVVVPGARELVRDRIEIRSLRILDEKQELEIVF